MRRITPGPGGPGGVAALFGLLGLAVCGLTLAGCLLAHLAPGGPTETLGPDGMWRPLVETFGLMWPVGTVVALLERIDRRAWARGGTGCAGMVRGWWAGVRWRVA